MDDEGVERSPDQGKQVSASTAWAIAGAVALLIVVVVVGTIAWSRPSTSTSTSNSGTGPMGSPSSSSWRDGDTNAPVTADWMLGACQGWARADDQTNGPNDDWCTSMADWMSSNGWGGSPNAGVPMMGAMMSGDAASVRSACLAWVTKVAPSGSAGSAQHDWCEEMADWMVEHRGSAGGWMMDGD